MSAAPFPTAMSRSASEDVDLLFHPNRRYARPADVLSDSILSLEERRAILSSWASDACAVDSAPALRRPPFATNAVSFDEIMDALLQLDRVGDSTRAKPRRRSVRPQPAIA